MKRALKTFGFILLLLVTLGNGGFFYYSLVHARAATVKSTTVSLAPKPTLKVASAKQHLTDASQQGKFLAEGEYAVNSLDKSRITEVKKGGLVLASYAASGANFVLATSGNTKIDDTIVADGWKTKLLADDPLWAPGACSSKPTLLLQGRYIFIDDGKTNPTDKYNSYLVFDMQTGKYNYFGGDSFTTKQATQEKIMLATNENDQLVLYIDLPDADGPQANTASFLHSTTHAPNYIVRRVIDPATMRYKDYKIPFVNPSSIELYNLSVYTNTSVVTNQKNESVTLNLSSLADANYQYTTFTGIVSNNAITLKEVHYDNSATGIINPGPFDTSLEKELNEPLSQALPNFVNGKPADPASYTTNFGLTALGSHGDTNYLVAASRTGGFAQTPVIIDTGGSVHPLTTKTIFTFGSYVPLGVF